jgi:hypothetical protein
LQIKTGEQVVSVGVSADNVLGDDPAPLLTQELLEARLHEELRRGGPPKASVGDVQRDWSLLQEAIGSGRESIVAENSARTVEASATMRAAVSAGGNLP